MSLLLHLFSFVFEVDHFAFIALTLLFGRQKGIRPVKTGYLFVCQERGTDLHVAHLMPLPLTLSCFSNIQICYTFLVPAHLGSPGKRAVKYVCVRACVHVFVFVCVLLGLTEQLLY